MESQPLELDSLPDYRGKAIVGKGDADMEEGGMIKGTAPPDTAGTKE